MACSPNLRAEFKNQTYLLVFLEILRGQFFIQVFEPTEKNHALYVKEGIYECRQIPALGVIGNFLVISGQTLFSSILKESEVLLYLQI
jgi:hypothetical protein